MVRFNFYFCRMKLTAGFVMLLLITACTHGQDTSATAVADTSRKDFYKIFQWTEIKKGEYEITVTGYDSLKMGNNDFQNFYYITTDKPDGKLTVKDGKGNKVRQCTYKNKLMFNEHWWFPSGEKEFDGTWSEYTNEYGDQLLIEYKWYYRNKKVRKHGFRTGLTTTYYSSGKTESEKMFRDGKPDGTFKEYFPNGKVQTEGQYADGNKTGEWIYYNMDGSVRERIR
jgi:antitoxin component YwqK of YwqJK toxin-antitoxin module